ncbi:hypothetical protein PSAB6_10019 [Paraburkholderia sabiae]|nr:hypothetical protein PSAB6_10019 [Paraburkholderia sabiae]
MATRGVPGFRAGIPGTVRLLSLCVLPDLTAMGSIRFYLSSDGLAHGRARDAKVRVFGRY